MRRCLKAVTPINHKLAPTPAIKVTPHTTTALFEKAGISSKTTVPKPSVRTARRTGA
ncbi:MULTISPECIES: hypothetical protein [unclassified Bartonella]|uniref:hypothetical protein n=1 Tax=unclassified Bartonella TaxID=2645622 RepID=UPI0035CF7C7E